MVLIVFEQFVVERKQVRVSQVKQLLCVKLPLLSLIFFFPLPSSSELGLSRFDEMSTTGLRYGPPEPFVCSCPH